MEEEIWKEIPGYESYYEVSTHGRVRSMDRVTPHPGSKTGFWKRKGAMMKTRYDRYGYLIVALCKDNKYTWLKIHRLVAMTFIPNPDNLETINHMDMVKTNNHVSNLEWCTFSYNSRHAAVYRAIRGIKRKPKKANEATGV